MFKNNFNYRLVDSVLYRNESKQFSNFIKKYFGIKSLRNLDPILVIEKVIPSKLFDNFTLVLYPEEEWPYLPIDKVLCNYCNNSIEIREDFYKKALNKDIFAINTIKKVVSNYIYYLYTNNYKQRRQNL